MDKKITLHSVIQVNELSRSGGFGCLAQVTELKKWGVIAFIKIPLRGTVNLRLEWHEIEYIGQAVHH
jgi:hypothetical protein